MELTERDWKPFRLIDEKLFYLDKCDTVKNTAETTSKGRVDVVGATSRNNGNVGFLEESAAVCQGNAICLIKTGQGSVGEAVYKYGEFAPSNNVYVIRSQLLNKFLGLFFVTGINHQADRYSYGYIRNEKRVMRETVMLPVDAGGGPDIAYMEKYIKEVEGRKKGEYIAYAQKMLKKMEFREVKALNEKSWSPFFLSDIFPEIQRGGRLKRADHFSGKKPYVSSSALDNGVDAFVQNEEGVRKYRNCLSLANSGSVGACFYQPYEFIASDHVTQLKNSGFSMYVYLFIAAMTKRLSAKYNFNREINDQRIKREKILLPTNGEGQPDYPYMEQYIKNLMIRKYESYLRYSGEGV